MTPTYIITTGRRVSVWDVDDIQAYVRNAIQRKTRLIISDRDEREELHAEGVAIALRMAERYQPHMPGYEKGGSFAGYLAQYLPRKIVTAWHQLHPEHVQRTVRLEDGRTTKVYEYGEAPRSLSDLHEGGEHGLRAVGDFVK